MTLGSPWCETGVMRVDHGRGGAVSTSRWPAGAEKPRKVGVSVAARRAWPSRFLQQDPAAEWEDRDFCSLPSGHRGAGDWVPLRPQSILSQTPCPPCDRSLPHVCTSCSGPFMLPAPSQLRLDSQILMDGIQ